MFIKSLDPAGTWLIDNETVYPRDGRPDSAEVNRAWIDLQSRINKQGLKPGRNRLLWRGVVAASIIILLGVIPLTVPQDVKNVSSEAEIQIRPGQRNAILNSAKLSFHLPEKSEILLPGEQLLYAKPRQPESAYPAGDNPNNNYPQ